MADLALIAFGQLIEGADKRNEANIAAANELAIADFEAKQLQRNAQLQRAAGSVEAKERRFEKENVISSQIAKAAASGAGVINPTVLDIIEDTEARGEIASRTELFTAEQRARGLETQAGARRSSATARAGTLRRAGKAAVRRSRFQAAATVISGIGDKAAQAAGGGGFG